MVDHPEVFRGDIDAHLDAQVVVIVDVPRARVTDNLTIARFDEHGTLPKSRGQGGESQGGKKSLAVADHFTLVVFPRLQYFGEVETWIDVGRSDQVVDVF